MKTTKLLICAVSIAAALASAKASAQNISASFVEITPVLSVNGTIDNGAFVQDYPSGVMHFTDFDAFCVEPQQGLSYGETLIYQVQDIGTLSNSDVIARLVGGYLASSQSSLNAAAVQWAIWETTSEVLSSPSLSNGNVRINPISQPVADLANQYLANVNTFTPATLTYLTNDTRQNVVTWNVVPEPASLSMAAFSAVLLLRRRR
jgi:hypothetical protein